MADAYVTLNEAAELEGTTYATMQRRVHRNPEKFLIDKEQRETGGKEMIMVAISSLSKKARTAWKEREKLKAVAEAPVQEADQAGETPWYVEEDIDWYIENRKEDWYKAMELGNIVREFLEYDERGRTEFAETFAQERLGKGKRTLYRYTKAYQEASAWADKMHKQDGGNYDFFKVLCLCRKPKEAGTFPSFTPEVKQVIKNIWFNKEFAQNQGTREMLYEKLQAIANINHWEKIPSYQSVARYISHLMNDEGMRNADRDDFILNTGDSKFLNFNSIPSSLSTAIISDYMSMTRPAKQQQRKVKTVTEWEKITKKDGTMRFPANSILLPTKLRRNGRVYVSAVSMYVSTNFTVYSYQTLTEAQVIGSYMTTVFYQLECEVASKDHSGMRKSELRDAKMTHVPDYNMLSQNQIRQILSEIPNITFKDLNNPTITHMDEIWAEILFGANASNKLEEAIRLQRFLANRRNPLS